MSAAAVAPDPATSRRSPAASTATAASSARPSAIRRRALLLVGGILAIILIAVSQAIVREFATPESRAGLAAVIAAVPPILQGLAGPVVNVDTLGGYMSYKYGTFFPLVASLWSILALSGTLASEARRGSLEFVAAAPISRQRIALEKLGGHLVALGIAVAMVFVALLIAGGAATLPGDEIPVEAAAGYALWLGAMALVAGALAFALAQFVGRGSAIGIAGAVMFAGFILNGYRTAIPEVAPFADLTWFGWTASHIPLAGMFDWASVGIVLVVAIVFLAIGVVAFVRRDLGATSAIPSAEPAARPGRPPRPDRPDVRRTAAVRPGLGPGHRPVRPDDRADPGSRSSTSWPSRRTSSASSRASSRTSTSRRSVASSSSCSSSSDTCWPGWRRRPSSPCGPRTRPPVDSSSCSRRRCRAGAGSSPAGRLAGRRSSWSR